ncbi:MAG TPA: hypothetical protein VNQ32_12590 [Steroidobacteraceae bacterium]|nr:hypothetical protein [Steroidobacteraceae bacterium]
MNTVRGAMPAARRLLAQNVMASTFQLVRSVCERAPTATIRELMGERQRQMADLARHVNTGEGAGSLAALRAAVAESDRTLEQLIG